MYKIIGSDQKEYGPISAEQVRQWFAEGRLNGESRIKGLEAADWKPLRELPEFAPLFPRPSTPPPIAAPFTHVFPAPSVPETNLMAKWAFGTGIFGLLCCQILGPVSIVLGIMALAELTKNPNQNGRGFAVAGIVLGSVAILLGVVVIMARLVGHGAGRPFRF